MNPKAYFITGTFHGALILADSEGKARRAFHQEYNGQTIVCVKIAHGKWLQKPPFEMMRPGWMRAMASLLPK